MVNAEERLKYDFVTGVAWRRPASLDAEGGARPGGAERGRAAFGRAESYR